MTNKEKQKKKKWGVKRKNRRMEMSELSVMTNTRLYKSVKKKLIRCFRTADRCGNARMYEHTFIYTTVYFTLLYSVTVGKLSWDLERVD